MRREVSTIALLGAIALAGCVGAGGTGEVHMTVESWDRPRETPRGGTCVDGEDLHHPTLEAENRGDRSVDLDDQRWEVVWQGETTRHVWVVAGADNLPPEATVTLELWFCPDDDSSGRPDEILLYDRDVYGTDDSTGAKVVGRLTV